jgi:hypothetical protein
MGTILRTFMKNEGHIVLQLFECKGRITLHFNDLYINLN